MFSAGLGGDEDDAAPIALQHAGHVGARQPDAGHHVDLEETAPVFIGNIEEPFRLENPGIVDEDIDFRQRGQQGLAAGGRGDIGGDAADLGSGYGFSHASCSGVDFGLAAAVDHHACAGRSKASGDRIADARRRARDQRGFSRKVDFHVPSPSIGDGDIGGGKRDRNLRASIAVNTNVIPANAGSKTRAFVCQKLSATLPDR